MKYTPLNVPPSYPIGATYMNTAPNETSPWVMPGTYTVRLIVDGKVLDTIIYCKNGSTGKNQYYCFAKTT